MHLQRIQVPDFRVLKDVDIIFEKEFEPPIFPLGSLNGGGKSTLLQLIFILLHCSIKPEQIEFLKNLLQGFKIREDEDKRVLAIIDIWHSEKTIQINFSSYPYFYFKHLLNEKYQNSQLNLKYNDDYISIRQDEISQKIESYFTSEGLLYICDYKQTEELYNNEEETAAILLCHIDGIDITEAEYFLQELSKQVFLAAPATQVFLFLSQECRKLLFRKENDQSNYYLHFEEAKSKLPGFFAYDFVAVELLIEAFIAARDRDFRQAIETGEYGNNYQAILNELKLVLGNKKVNITTDFSGISFTLDKDGETIELYPEDLSHGELKRLSIYIWLKYRNIEDAIVLMDEIEIAFHPDWQYQIISDLKEWAPNNQYILATHSYELCQALTPSHVKEIEPKLIKPESQN
ncbi:MAG TPA: ATP-binding protein [Cyanobacteria bacterium UBA11149]|nr:ATP-binding protein [Cyanobacteria bacterium UBA11367]HBE59103.1 ATP-binding protein [Cyanobacteria bacterium UBA11366]HBK64111.1 ATP-binding protein [Cyanobacteria bacterium UBA11166]HBR74815.1 ATP-binding protein [Cyanobacteria bacterium UBA11159]HBS67961.1 ATP-binding protein [Cyanobacteria bacterium UBA11153]HBW87469.1 ATP-binding protein [Cyanobacteria bacterium UBA11149]HCA94068.1 ATP-binding protein [Cyanobacteria bacterium UBA9226]